MKNIVMDHVNLTVASFKESVEWYKNIFGFELVEEGLDQGKPWGIVRNGNHMLCIYEEPEGIPLDFNNPAHARFHQIYHFGLRIRDRAEWEKTLAQFKPKVLYGGAMRYPHSTSWYVKDPTGYEIEVSYWDNDELKFG